MRILVIPDVHLKDWMFELAANTLKGGVADRAVCLMDLADDFGQAYNLDQYIRTYDAAIDFAKEFPDTLWCYGNHDICYEINMRETGYSKIAGRTVCEKLGKLQSVLPDPEQLSVIHVVDSVMFLHGGLTQNFVGDTVPDSIRNDPFAVAEYINHNVSKMELWHDWSPIWFRPQTGRRQALYKEGEILQVVGHTPVKQPMVFGGALSCDTFSTYADGTNLGSEEFVVVDTETKEWKSIPGEKYR